jgi:sulfur dioxygenase
MTEEEKRSKVIFRQLFDPLSSTYTYIIGCDKTKEAVIVDTVWEHTQRDAHQLERLGLSLKYIIETHVHADHVSGAIKLHQELKLSPQVPIVHGWNSGVEFGEEHKHLQLRFVKDYDKIEFGERYLLVRETPGHTNHHLAFVMDDESFCLSGCSLYIGRCGRTDFQGGSSRQMFESIMDKLYKLPDSCVLYPGHDYHGCLYSTIGEEKKFNHRIPENQTLEKFEHIMQNLNLRHPAKIHTAVPANIKGGVMEEESNT